MIFFRSRFFWLMQKRSLFIIIFILFQNYCPSHLPWKYPLKIGWTKIQSQEIRLSSVSCRQRRRKSSVSGERPFRLMVSGCFSMFLINCSSVLAVHGVSPCRIQQKMKPNAQISHLLVYSSPFRIYRDMQRGVPTQVLTMDLGPICLAKPKSPNFSTFPFFITLAGFKSRCIMPSFTNAKKPLQICLSISTASASGLCMPGLISPARSPSHNSWMIQQFLELSITSQKPTMLSECNFCMISISFFSAALRYQSRSTMIRREVLLSLERILAATYCPVDYCLARQTLPQLPLPRTLVMKMEQPSICFTAINYKQYNTRHEHPKSSYYLERKLQIGTMAKFWRSFTKETQGRCTVLWGQMGKYITIIYLTTRMGSNQSLAQRLPLIAKEHWHEIPLPPSVRRKALHGHYKLFKNVLTNERIEQYQLTLQGDHYQQYIQSFLYRMQQEAIVATRYFQETREETYCGCRVEAKVYLQHTPYRLSVIRDVPLPQSLYVLVSALTGFEKLQTLVGSFRPSEDMVGVDCEGRVKVWLSPDFSSSLLSAPLYQQGNAKQCESSMVMELVSLVDQNTAYQQAKIPTILNYFQGAKDTISFKEAQRMVTEYAEKYDLTIPKYFVSLLRLLESSRRLSDDYESHSQANDPFASGQERPHIVHYISPVLLSNHQIPSKEQIKSFTRIQPEQFQRQVDNSTSHNSYNNSAVRKYPTNNTSMVQMRGLPQVNFNYSSRAQLKDPMQLPLMRIAQRSSAQSLGLTRRVTYSDMREDYELDEQLAQDLVRFMTQQ